VSTILTSASVYLLKVGGVVAETITLSPQDISAHLLNDWLPGVPAGQGADFMGWPNRLLSYNYGQLCLSDVVAQTERQWKGMISWMLGVAGARIYLKDDGYRWIAPISAFFEDAVQPVNVPQWYIPFPQPNLSVVRIRKRVFCPDYIVARSSAPQGPVEWAVAEAKGTKKSLTFRTACEPNWQEQVRNVRISIDGSPLVPQRHIVIATRVNASEPLRIKAWNNSIPQYDDAFSRALPEVVSAHLFGFYIGAGLSKIARRLASAVFRRAPHKRSANLNWARVNGEDVTNAPADEAQAPLEVRLDRGEVSALIEISKPLQSLTAALTAVASENEAMKVIRMADRELDDWWVRHRDLHEPQTVTLPFGARIRFFDSRG
jgi:hypothetical protein